MARLNSYELYLKILAKCTYGSVFGTELVEFSSLSLRFIPIHLFHTYIYSIVDG